MVDFFIFSSIFEQFITLYKSNGKNTDFLTLSILERFNKLSINRYMCYQKFSYYLTCTICSTNLNYAKPKSVLQYTQ